MSYLPVFLSPTKEIVSYGILYELAKLSGFPVYNTRIEREDGVCYIKTMYHPPELIGDKGKVVLWFLERPSISGGLDCMREELKRYSLSGVDEIWVSDRYLFNNFKDLVRFVPIGSHEGLAKVSDDKIYDVADMSYRAGRRLLINNLRCRLAPNTYAEDRATILSHTKFLLNVHQFEDQCSEPLRFALAAAAGIPIISEVCLDPYPYEAPGFIQLPYNDIIGVAEKMVQEYPKYIETGRNQRERILRDFNFRDNVLRAIENI